MSYHPDRGGYTPYPNYPNPNDPYAQRPHTTSPNPYDNNRYFNPSDPFVTPHHEIPVNAYPDYPSHPSQSPVPHRASYSSTPFQPPPPPPQPLYQQQVPPPPPISASPGYQLHDTPNYPDPSPVEHYALENPYETEDNQGDIPLLRHRANSDYDRTSTPGFPGGYEPSIHDGPESNIRYGRIPQRVPRRYKTIKRIELFHGNYVYDAAVPTKLLNMCANRVDREYTHLRYTGATCDPNDFLEEGYTLRQVLYDPPRRTELFIVMTMYNEDEELFCRTMHGVMKNIAHLCTRDRSKTWGKEGWKKVVVCIVSDGREKINSRTLSVIAAMGAYQDGVAKNAVNKKPVTAHIYEYTTQISVSPSMKIEGAEKGVVPVQVIFCLKEKNQKKINSHRWFFNAFGPILQPNVCVLLDVGTMPGPTSIYHLWKAFDINSNVGGACGEIVALKGKWGLNLLNPLVAAQNFEYKMSNILDKPLESIFGYITVLPGAFSAYRYIALQNDPQGEGPLQKYFLGEKMHGADADIFTANMYLAEDRILCWELVSKRGGAWILHYVKSAYAVTDVPDQVPELISQRRRWLNGSFFAAIHSTVKFKYIYRSSHSFARKFWIHIELFYQTFNLLFSWFALGNYYIAFIILSKSMEDLLPQVHIPNLIMQYVYLGLLTMCFLLALGNRPQGSKWPYTGAMIGFGFITIYMTFAAFYLAIRGAQDLAKDQRDGTLTFGDVFTEPKFGQIVLSLLATLGLYILASLLFFEPWHMITSFLQYLLLAPSYISVLNVYAFANVHDISWGTKGDNKIATDLGVVATSKAGDKETVDTFVPTDEKDINAAYDDALHVLGSKPPKVEQKVDDKTKQEDYYKSFRTNVLLAWTLSNGLLAAVITTAADKSAELATIYMSFILYSVAGLAFFRFVGSTSYMIVRLFAGE